MQCTGFAAQAERASESLGRRSRTRFHWRIVTGPRRSRGTEPKIPSTGAVGVPDVAEDAASHSANAEPGGRIASVAIGIARQRVRNCFRKKIVVLPNRRHRVGVSLEAPDMIDQD